MPTGRLGVLREDTTPHCVVRLPLLQENLDAFLSSRNRTLSHAVRAPLLIEIGRQGVQGHVGHEPVTPVQRQPPLQDPLCDDANSRHRHAYAIRMDVARNVDCRGTLREWRYRSEAVQKEQQHEDQLLWSSPSLLPDVANERVQACAIRGEARRMVHDIACCVAGP